MLCGLASDSLPGDTCSPGQGGRGGAKRSEDSAAGNNNSIYRHFTVQMIEISFKIFYSASWVRLGGMNKWNKRELQAA